MLFLEFGSIFSRKNSKGRIRSVFEGGVCQLYTSYHSSGSIVCRNPTWIAARRTSVVGEIVPRSLPAASPDKVGEARDSVRQVPCHAPSRRGSGYGAQERVRAALRPRPALHQGPEIHVAVAPGEPHARRQE